jgi:Protein of unknown function (DUF3969)
MSQPLLPTFIDLLSSSALSDKEIRCLVGWYALSLADLLRRRCITVRYAEQVLFNLDVVRQLEKRRLKDCVELIDWGMQLEDWEEHAPEQLSEAINTVAQLAQQLLARSIKSSSILPKLARQRTQHQTSSHLP